MAQNKIYKKEKEKKNNFCIIYTMAYYLTIEQFAMCVCVCEQVRRVYIDIDFSLVVIEKSQS